MTVRGLISGECRQLRSVKCYAHVRAAARPVEEGDLAHMFLNDLLDDGEAQTGPSHSRGHIGLGQPLALLRKADPGIENVDNEIVVLAMKLQLNAVSSEAMLTTISAGFNGFNTVFHNIGERLGELPSIADHAELPARRVDGEVDRGMSDFVKEQRLTGDVVHILLAEHGFGHA